MEQHLKEIINRRQDLLIDESEMVKVVEEYIFQRKGKRVKIDILKGCVIFNKVLTHKYLQQIDKLTVAFAMACSWFKEKKLV